MPKELALGAEAIRFIEGRLQQIRSLESELNGALALILEQNGLQGKWMLDLPGKRLVPAEQTQSLKAA